MAKKKTTSTTKLKKQVRKKVRKIEKNPVFQITLITLIIIAALIYYFFFYEKPIGQTYGSEQNAEGCYYYSLVENGSYYSQANSLQGESLKDTLHTILNTGFTPTTYGEARQILGVADALIDDPSLVYTIYSSATVTSTWDGGDSWTREHVWPNSRLGLERVENHQRNQASVLHNLRAIVQSVNASRSDRYFTAGSGLNQTTTEDGYYPGDEHKGDVARILFYMATMYDFLQLADEGFDVGETYTMDRVTMGKLSVLLDWHKEDPVDAFETKRNQVIYEAQGNRNPYIDKPEYVHLIWENKTIQDLTKVETTTLLPGLRISFLSLVK
ncbi:endonuclease [Acholeplasma vituli]|uniref:Endonuclease n=1 Tax=Paracholeplasma vituli TaxID=69473 RepID=A0ABT2PW28_9MOLU|nr:endonuclease [Paracholeplasma vituli]MCU0104626.1 endonuclease [Paracholeplasma vituli]